MTIFRSKQSYVKGREPRPVRTALWYAWAAIAVIAMFVGPHYLAREVFDTLRPTGDQIRTARMLVGLIVIAPFAVVLGWMWWDSRGAQAAWMKRREGARLEDPSKQSMDER